MRCLNWGDILSGETGVVSLLEVMKKLAGTGSGCYSPSPGTLICPSFSITWDPNAVHSLRDITLSSFYLLTKGIKYTPEGNSSLSLIQLSKD